MLVYPNYEREDKKKSVIMELAQRFQYNPNPDIEYSYNDDFNQRMHDFAHNKYKKVSHICINDYNSKNHIKRASHIQKIIKREKELTMFDNVILSTDEQTNLIYIYQPSGQKNKANKIDIYFYENNIVNTNNATTLPTQIYNMEKLYRKRYDSDTSHKTFYINSVYRDVVSTTNLITTEWFSPDLKVNKDMLDITSRGANFLDSAGRLGTDQDNDLIDGGIMPDPSDPENYVPISTMVPAHRQFLYSFIEDPSTGDYF